MFWDSCSFTDIRRIEGAGKLPWLDWRECEALLPALLDHPLLLQPAVELPALLPTPAAAPHWSAWAPRTSLVGKAPAP